MGKQYDGRGVTRTERANHAESDFAGPGGRHASEGTWRLVSVTSGENSPTLRGPPTTQGSGQGATVLSSDLSHRPTEDAGGVSAAALSGARGSSSRIRHRGRTPCTPAVRGVGHRALQETPCASVGRRPSDRSSSYCARQLRRQHPLREAPHTAVTETTCDSTQRHGCCAGRAAGSPRSVPLRLRDECVGEIEGKPGAPAGAVGVFTPVNPLRSPCVATARR